MKEYLVTRQHYGDKQYYAGDTRTVDDDTARYLIDLGVIKAITEEKAEPEHKNKSEPEHKNKAESVPKNKSQK
ncbi:hypothetical protein [Suttonella ornithocola]|uniref:Uncharacterized protein n=1 Tax=Suttonella ornithocola TaxID=279832 RepID=A0A380MT64_9GAMM|nr:hypothetical protein [Suttonella ornithocola]SUO95256.1 Uncharacterised protein [Suttonella ornithocola]